MPEERIVEVVRQGITGTYLGFIPKAHSLIYPRAALKKELIEAFPTFSKVSISRSSLAALHVAVRERQPQALWCAGMFGCFLVDETGFVFAPAETGTEKLYYRLEKEATSSPLGTEVLHSGSLAASVAFLKELQTLGFNPERMLFQREKDIEVLLSDNVRLLRRRGLCTRFPICGPFFRKATCFQGQKRFQTWNILTCVSGTKSILNRSREDV